MERIAKGWFSEFSPNGPTETAKLSWRGQAFSLQFKQVLFQTRSEFQDILILDSETYGRVLVLDGVIQCTERDEFAYQEMMANVPLHLHPNPKRVLIIGGGDGGVAREVLKHEGIEIVVVVEIDETVINACRGFLPSMAKSFDNPLVRLQILDGVEFLKKCKEKFDVIIIDSTDPVGPGESLFSQTFYHLLSNALNENGVVMTQAESIWLHMDLIVDIYKQCKEIFPVVDYCYTMVPTYPSGVIGHMVCSKNQQLNPRVPLRRCEQNRVQQMGLKYYDSDVHGASFQLPVFAKTRLLEATSVKE